MKSSYNRIVEVFKKLKLQKMKEIGRLIPNAFTSKKNHHFDDSNGR